MVAPKSPRRLKSHESNKVEGVDNTTPLASKGENLMDWRYKVHLNNGETIETESIRGIPMLDHGVGSIQIEIKENGRKYWRRIPLADHHVKYVDQNPEHPMEKGRYNYGQNQPATAKKGANP